MIRRRTFPILAGGGLLSAGALLVWMIAGSRTQPGAQAKADRDNAMPQVHLISAAVGPQTRSISIPGTIKAWYAAPIYAQVPGYVRMWYKDYGAPVKAGDRLASIDAPGLDQQYATARANLDAAKARYKLAALAAKRWTALSGTQAVAEQEVDVQVATAASLASQVQAAGHEVARYQALEQFKDVVAPFDGVVTARNTDVGAYVNAAGGDAHARGGSAELFSVADIHKMRVFVSVPQDYSAMLKPGLTAALSLPQFPGRSFKARLDTTANAFDPATRTVITELAVENPDRLIWPGTYADVLFTTGANPDILIVPQQALLFGAAGMRVALVGPDSKVHLQAVRVGNDLGQSVEVTAGLKATDHFIDNPSAGLLDGDLVDVLPGAASSGTQTGGVIGPKHPSPAQRTGMEAARVDKSD